MCPDSASASNETILEFGLSFRRNCFAKVSNVVYPKFEYDYKNQCNVHNSTKTK